MVNFKTHELILDIPGKADGMPLSIEMLPGQVWGVLGPNGAGKSTLLHTLAGLRQPRSGEILLEERTLNLWRRKALAQNLGMIFQERHDEFPATVLESVLIGRHPFLSSWQLESGQDYALARQALQTLDLADLEERMVNTLSGGERQRVSIATVLTQSPKIWLADEPTNHLDLHHQVAVLQLLRKQSRQGCAVVMSLHDINLAARWCDQILLMYPDGQLCWGPASLMLVPDALQRLYGQPLVSTFLAGASVFVPVLDGDNTD